MSDDLEARMWQDSHPAAMYALGAKVVSTAVAVEIARAAVEEAWKEGFNNCLQRAIDIAEDNNWSVDPVESILDELNELWIAE